MSGAWPSWRLGLEHHVGVEPHPLVKPRIKIFFISPGFSFLIWKMDIIIFIIIITTIVMYCDEIVSPYV